MSAIKGKTSSGFEFNLDEEALDDMEVLEWLIEMDNGDVAHLKDMLVRLLGDEQKKALYNHCRKNGRVSAKAVLREVGEIFKESGEQAKN